MRAASRAIALALICSLLAGLYFPAATAPSTHAAIVLAAQPTPKNTTPPLPTPSNNTTISCGSLGPHPQDSANATGNGYLYFSQILVLWNKLCVEPRFVYLINFWGGLGWWTWRGIGPSYWAAWNLSGGSYANNSVPFVAEWSITWQMGCDNVSLAPANYSCQYNAAWTGNVTSENTSGPVQTETPPCQFTPMGCILGGSPPPGQGETRNNTTVAVTSAGFPTVDLLLGAGFGGLAAAFVYIFISRKPK
jgi:hypothetical protein